MQGAHCQQLRKITTETAVIQKIKKQQVTIGISVTTIINK